MGFKEHNNANELKKLLIILSDAELEVLKLIKKGLTSSEIAEKRNCSSRTVEKHRSNIIKKLNIKSSQNALMIWVLQNFSPFNT